MLVFLVILVGFLVMVFNYSSAVSSIAERRESSTFCFFFFGVAFCKTMSISQPVNLASGDGHPAEIMDMSFSIQALSLMYLVENSGNLYNIIYDVPKKIDEKVAEIKLKSMDVHIDSLNKEQERYYNWE